MILLSNTGFIDMAITFLISTITLFLKNFTNKYIFK